MGVLPFVCLGPEGSCLFQVDNLNQSNLIQGCVITKNFHYQRFGGISWKRFYQRHTAPDVLLVGETRSSELDDRWVQRLVRDTSQPRMIILSHKPGSILTRMDRFKALDRKLRRLGYPVYILNPEWCSCDRRASFHSLRAQVRDKRSLSSCGKNPG